VDSFAVQLARWRGARVIATAGPRNLDYVRGLGAEPVDHTRQRLDGAVRGVDAVLDLVGGEWLFSPAETARRGLRGVGVVAQANRFHLDALARLLDGGSLAVELAELFPLAEAARAQAISQDGHVRGKLALAVRT
jgi:NADPH:quinone reductase-like Zn-dependent oxidoreductase